VATVEAIYDATIQVLLKDGPDRLTTVYQYFPNKQALLFAVLERHMLRVAKAVEDACATNHFRPLEVMLDEVVNRFIDAKLTDRDRSVALYKIAADAGGKIIVDRVRRRFEAAMTAILRTANLPVSADLSFMAHMIYLSMTGTLRGHLESNAPPEMLWRLREHLAKLTIAYCRAM